MDLYDNDSDLLKEKLQIKTESLLLISQQLENTIKENLEYKRIIDTLYDKNFTLKKKLFNDDKTDNNMRQKFSHSKDVNNNRSQNEIDSEGYIKILKDLIKTLKKEKSELAEKLDLTKQHLNDCKIDLKLLREQLTRQRVGNLNEGLTTSITSTTGLSERELKSIKELELATERNLQLENDVKLILCEKEELEIERDALRLKVKSLNDTNRNDSQIDEIKEENKRLQDKIDKMKALDTTEKSNFDFKNETLKKTYTKAQIKVVLNKTESYLAKCKQLNKSQNSSFSYMNELHELCTALFDNVVDKNVALEHQRKCNRMLAERIKDLELEISNNNRKDLSLIKFDECDDEFSVDHHNQSTVSEYLSTSNDKLLNDSYQLNENFKKINLDCDNQFINT